MAALFALGVFLVSLPSGTRPANATPTGATTVNPISQPTLGGTAIVTATYNDDQPSANPSSAILSTTNPTIGIFLNGAASVAPLNGEVVTVTTATVTVTEDADAIAATKTISATFICQTAGVTTFILTHGGSASATNGSITCGSGAGTGTATITATPQLVPLGGQGQITVSFTTTAGQNVALNSSPAYAIFATPNVTPASSGETFVGINTANLSFVAIQSIARQLYVNFTCTQVGNVTFNMTINGQIVGTSNLVVCGQGTSLTPTVGPASSITVAASPTSVSCNGTAFVTVTVRNSAGGYVADGTSVSLTASMGSLSPTTATTLGGGVLAVYTAPGNQSGTASIQAASSGTATGNASITVACQSATPTPAAPPTIFVPPPAVNPGSIAPPNTGDAGLADGQGWATYAGIAMIIISVMATAAVVRARA
jgi:hypothetical protein